MATNEASARHRRPEAWPRVMRREMAADYVGISPSLFDQWVEDGTLPKPTRKNGVTMWDRHEIDASLDRLFQADSTVWDD